MTNKTKRVTLGAVAGGLAFLCTKLILSHKKYFAKELHNSNIKERLRNLVCREEH